MRLRITGQTAKGSRGKAAFAKPKLMTDLTMNVKKLFSAIGANIRKIFL